MNKQKRFLFPWEILLLLRAHTTTTSTQCSFTDLDGWNKIISKDIIQSTLNFEFIVCAEKEFLIPINVNQPIDPKTLKKIKNRKRLQISRLIPLIKSIIRLLGLMSGIISARGRDYALHDDRRDNSGALNRTKRGSVQGSSTNNVRHDLD